ncbi:hypothetical protein NXS19_012248 [Fusarium pseudograminearum]|nr:hypothetical protein NXS19_012248 [Fusarium pseudograminearum]
MSSTATASSAGSRAGSVASSNSKRRMESSDEEHPNKCSKLQHSTVKIRVEAPLLEDFTKECGIPTAQFAWGPRPESPAEESFDEDETADPPSVPIINPKYPKPRNVARPVNHLPTKNKPNEAPKERSLMDLPAEIREEIYRGLLVSHKPVPVYDGWKKKIFNEAIRVLYGENTFLYRLRDMPTESHRMINIQELARSNAYVPSQGYRDQIRAAAACEAGTINIRKYACLFRYITLQADHNRSEFYTQEFMVDAIKTFAQEPGMTNIHTLTIIVSPRYTRGRFTFVDWFDSRSELVCALKAVCCEIIRIRIWNKHLNDGLGPISSVLFLRVHQLRFLRQLEYQKLHDEKPQTKSERLRPDIWAGDWKMEKLRRRRGREIISRLERLRPCVLEACKKHLEPHIKRQGDLEDADDDDDDDNDDDDDENWFAYFPDEVADSEAEEASGY